MPNIYGLLNVGRNALIAQQKAIDVTGNNIANANTPGYSRQRVIFEQSPPIREYGGSMSTGVTVDQHIQRFFDPFINAQINAENENLGRWDAQKTALEKVEVMFDEMSGFGLNGAMADFWNAWQDLSNNPAGHVERTSMLSAGQYLTTTFTQLRQNVVGVQEDIDGHVENIVNDINLMANQIAELNRKIVQVEVSGHNANEYRDDRDALVKNLAELIDIDSFEDGNGNMTISIGQGKPLVEATSTWPISTAMVSGSQVVNWEDSSGTTTDITSRINGGELKGWIEVRDNIIQGYIDDLDELATGIINEVNALHSAGYALDGSQNNFFTGSDASDMAINPGIVADVGLIAAASDVAALPGDNSTAIAIADLQSQLTMSGGSSTFDDFYSGLVGEVGSDVRTANLNYDHQEALVLHLENYREEVSGVSLDEEMVKLVQFQHAYNAAAKLITTTDELLDSLLAIKR
jgi:flagellar hook-associated protein 1 FlgK